MGIPRHSKQLRRGAISYALPPMPDMISHQLPRNSEQRGFVHLLLQLHFKLGDQAVALCLDFILTGKQCAAQTAASVFEFVLVFWGVSLFFESRSPAAIRPPDEKKQGQRPCK